MKVIEVEGLSKSYRLYGSPLDRLRELFSRTEGKHHREFDALRDVSLSVDQGETVGIIGKNGSGKSTLLKILTGVIRPTSGNVSVNGRISSLLELGAGFNPEFTGRDNVYMNGALKGLSRKEMDRRFPTIEAFADIGEFIGQPVRTYSSGMYMRLAFSAAINVDPDILILDEILSVGDENFKSKCHQRIQELRQAGTTVLLVSHDMFTVENLCNRVFLLGHGRVLAHGNPGDVITAYKNMLHGTLTPDRAIASGNNEGGTSSSSAPREFKRWGTRDVEITGVRFTDDQGMPVEWKAFEPKGRFAVRIEFFAPKRVNRLVVGMAIHRQDGIQISGSNTRESKLDMSSVEGKGAVEFVVERLPLLPGRYYFTACVSDVDVFVPYDMWYQCLPFTVVRTGSGNEGVGVLDLDGEWTAVRD